MKRKNNGGRGGKEGSRSTTPFPGKEEEKKLHLCMDSVCVCVGFTHVSLDIIKHKLYRERERQMLLLAHDAASVSLCNLQRREEGEGRGRRGGSVRKS